MTEFNSIDIRKFDGSLLLIFHELLKRRRATEVAGHLGLSQPAISHALNRLRDLFSDPLFVRLPHGLEPTQRALKLGPEIERLLEQTAQLLSCESGFDPLSTTRRFSLVAADLAYLLSLIGPPLVRTFQDRAPKATFVLQSLGTKETFNALRRGNVDFAIGVFDPLPPDVESELLFEDEYCVVARKGHPNLKRKVTMADYRVIDHVFVGQPVGSHFGLSSSELEQMSKLFGTIPDENQVSTSGYVPQWETALFIAATTDAIADCPRRFAMQFAKKLDLQIFDPPYESKLTKVQLVQRAKSQDPGAAWFAEQIRGAVI